MKIFCPYPHTLLYPLLAEASERFGTSRLVWGSNYPVVGDEQDYASDLRLLLDGRLPLPDEAIAAIVRLAQCRSCT
jgi:predicted TIM-barrel fold metal-dependent hydrolase